MLKNSQKILNKTSGQRRAFSLLLKAVYIFGILFCSYQAHAGVVDEVSYHDTDGYNGFGYSAFIPGIAPMFDIYSYWDTLNLDPYQFDFKTLGGTMLLPVLSEDCGFSLPVAGVMTSPFGWRWGRNHAGVDLTLKNGDTVVSAFDGVVRMSRWYYGYGNCVVIRHHNGLETLYGHLSARLVNSGDLVNAGQLLGLGGSTGYSTGPHLHFETRFMGKAFNPQSLIDFKTDSLLRDTLVFDTNSFIATPPVAQKSTYKRGKANYYRKPASQARKKTAYRRKY